MSMFAFPLSKERQQEVFEKVATHLLTQMKQSILYLGMCAYRSPDGLKCAIGCLMPDDEYDPQMECTAIEGMLLKTFPMPTIRQVYQDVGPIFLSHLQQIHDRFEPSSWRSQLESLAIRFNLDHSKLPPEATPPS